MNFRGTQFNTDSYLKNKSLLELMVKTPVTPQEVPAFADCLVGTFRHEALAQGLTV